MPRTSRPRGHAVEPKTELLVSAAPSPPAGQQGRGQGEGHICTGAVTPLLPRGSFPGLFYASEPGRPATIIAAVISVTGAPRHGWVTLVDSSPSTKRREPAEPSACPHITPATGCVSAGPGILLPATNQSAREFIRGEMRLARFCKVPLPDGKSPASRSPSDLPLFPRSALQPCDGRIWLNVRRSRRKGGEGAQRDRR